MPLTLDRFDLATFARADPDRYLILGYDTDPSPIRKQATPVSKTIRCSPLQER